jgi:hypothetical protein
MAHAVRDGGFTGPVSATDTGEHYDLVIVGAAFRGCRRRISGVGRWDRNRRS